MSDQELFDPARIAARQAEAAEYQAKTVQVGVDVTSPETSAVFATLGVNGMSAAFDGTYPHAGTEKRAGWVNPPPPGSGQ